MPFLFDGASNSCIILNTDIENVRSADPSETAYIPAKCEVIKIEGEIDKILFGGRFKLRYADYELIVFETVEALHALCKVVELVKISISPIQNG